MKAQVIPLSAEMESNDPVSLNDFPKPEIYTVRQAAKLLQINISLAYELVRQGVIPAKRLGRRWIIPRSRFHAWLNTQ